MERAVDAAEKWLKKNDPNYARRDWCTPQTDALEHQSSKAKIHGSIQDLVSLNSEDATRIPGAHGIPRVVGDGNYRRQVAIVYEDKQRQNTGRP